MRMKYAIAGTCVLGLLVGAGWVVMLPRAGEAVDLRPARERAQTQRAAFAAVERRPVDESSEHVIKALIEETFDLSTNELGGISEQVKEKLSTTIASHVAALSSPDPDAWARLADHEPTRWITKDDRREWMIIDSITNHLWGRAGDRSDPRSELVRFRAYSLDHGARVRAIGIGEGGALIRVRRIRRPDDLYAYALTAEDSQRWIPGSTAGVIWFRRPVVSLEDVLRRDRQAMVAEVYFNLEIEKGSFIWRTVWYYDQRGAVWHLRESSAAGWLADVGVQY